MFIRESAVDLFLSYQFLRRFSTPFTSWDAFKSGIIDDKGNVLIKGQLGYFDRITLNLKKLLSKIPGGSSFLGRAAASLLLLKEGKDIDNLTEDVIIEKYNKILEDIATGGPESGGGITGIGSTGINITRPQFSIALKSGKKKPLKEDGAPINSAGSGAIAGIGVTRVGNPLNFAEPGVSKKRKIILQAMQRRKVLNF